MHSRRQVLQGSGALAAGAALHKLLPSYAQAGTVGQSSSTSANVTPRGDARYDLMIAETAVTVGGRRATATTINGTMPGPLIRLREGQNAVLRVSNKLEEDTSIHWHGILLPFEMDGVPGISFAGIRPGQTFEYRFPLKQYGTYWYHSHSGLQEQLGHYGPLVVEPEAGHPYKYDREHFIVLSDWTFEDPERILSKLKKQPDYYNFQRRTLGDFFSDIGKNGFLPTVRDRWMWAEMRMNPTDIADLTGATFTYLINGSAPTGNWTGLFKPGERVLLHFINASAATFFDVRIPGLPMTVVEASGQHVKPVQTDEIRIAIAETYNVIVEPKDDRPYTVFAEAMDRSGYARGTLAPREGVSGPIPERRKRPTLSMADMGMDHGTAGGAHARHGEQGTTKADQSAHAGHGVPAKPPSPSVAEKPAHEGHDMPGMQAGQDNPDVSHAGHDMKEPATDEAQEAVAGAIRTTGLRAPGTIPGMQKHEKKTHGVGNGAVPAMVGSRLAEPGIGLGADGWRVLTYADLRALEKRADFSAPTREIEMHLTGNMERFMWSIDGVPFERSEPVRFAYGERLRLTMVNDTMMNHPMHLHGMWMELENGAGDMIPRVHTVNVKPAERLSLLITADAPGPWAFHCHVLYHMEVGMFRVVEVSSPVASTGKGGEHHHGK